jgi:hypothetical protein
METKGIPKRKTFKDISKENEKKFSKFHNISKLIVGKVDDILGSYNAPIPGYASATKNTYSESSGLSKNILENKELNFKFKSDSPNKEGIDINSKVNNRDNKTINKDILSEKSLPSVSTHSSKRENNIKSIKEKIIRDKKTIKSNNNTNYSKTNNFNNQNIEKNDNKEYKEEMCKQNKILENKNKHKEIKHKDKHKVKDRNEQNDNKKNQKDVFMTKVGIEGKIRSSSSENEEKINYEEDLLESSSDEECIKTNLEPKKVDDFRNMIEEIEYLKQGAKNEFDELQYLINYVGKASTRVNRHIYGVSNLFKESGLNSNKENRKNLNKYMEDSDDNNSERNTNKNYGIYDKEKNMGKIKDNLINMQDNFIGFYKNFDSKMKNIENDNKKFKNKILYDKTKK